MKNACKKVAFNTNQNDHSAIKKLNFAEFLAWGLFVGIGVTYVVLTLVLPNNV
jgi:hypothetical protein